MKSLSFFETSEALNQRKRVTSQKIRILNKSLCETQILWRKKIINDVFFSFPSAKCVTNGKYPTQKVNKGQLSHLIRFECLIVCEHLFLENIVTVVCNSVLCTAKNPECNSPATVGVTCRFQTRRSPPSY